jgi:hypothetical protein
MLTSKFLRPRTRSLARKGENTEDDAESVCCRAMVEEGEAETAGEGHMKKGELEGAST